MLKITIVLCLVVGSLAVEVNEHIIRNGNMDVAAPLASQDSQVRTQRQFGFSGSGAQAGASSFGGGFGGGGYPGYGGGFSGSQAGASAGSFGGGFGR